MKTQKASVFFLIALVCSLGILLVGCDNSVAARLSGKMWVSQKNAPDDGEIESYYSSSGDYEDTVFHFSKGDHPENILKVTNPDGTPFIGRYLAAKCGGKWSVLPNGHLQKTVEWIQPYAVVGGLPTKGQVSDWSIQLEGNKLTLGEQVYLRKQ